MASSSSSSPARRYDVFLSFKGEDTRNGFTSHLHEALSRSKISTFIDNNLRRGDDISPSLLTAIEVSNISIIIFSEDYANSKCCLKELAKILQCKELNGQIVIPVFYGVDPSHIRKQTGKFGVAFDKLRERLREGEMDLNEVRSHLKEAAKICGWASQDWSSENKLIDAIVGDVSNKLNLVTMNLPTSFVGISSHVERVEALLCLDSPEFHIVGLWGMGKTTIAQGVFNRIYSKFDGFHFVENVSKKLKSRSVNGLREEIVLNLFEESLNMGNRTLRRDFIMRIWNLKNVTLKVVLPWILLLTNFILEILLLILDQIASVQKPLYGLMGLVVAYLAMLVCVGELVYEGWTRKITLKRQGMRCWIQYPPSDDRPLLSWLGVFSLACAIAQIVFSTFGYSCLQQNKENPIKVSIVSVIYTICLFAAKISNNPIEEGLPISQ